MTSRTMIVVDTFVYIFEKMIVQSVNIENMQKSPMDHPYRVGGISNPNFIRVGDER